jgi:glycosyltransferase involved in cell wall biosynthesis
MRICMISSVPFPPWEGIGYYVWNLSRHLTNLGHKVSIITRGGAGQTSREHVDGITIWRPTFWPVYPIHVHLHSPFVNRLLDQLAGEFDLLHLHTPLVQWPTTHLSVLVTVHTPRKTDTAAVPTDTLLGWLVKLQAPVSYTLEQQLFDRAGKLVAVASSVAQELQAYGVDPQRVEVLGNGVDADTFRPGQPGLLNGTGPYFLTVARLAPRKGLEDLVCCAEYVAERLPQVRFFIAGTGPLEGSLRLEISRRGLDEQVILLGHITDRARLVKWYQGAAAYIHPAHYEGLATVLLEAMACGRPVIATAVSGALDVVQHGRNGLLVPSRDPEGLGLTAMQLLGNPDFATALGLAARQTIEQRYSWDIVGQNYLAQYEALLQGVQV